MSVMDYRAGEILEHSKQVDELAHRSIEHSVGIEGEDAADATVTD